MPVSSTHIAIGGVFGVGFLREALTNKGIPNPAVHPRTRFMKVSALTRTTEAAVIREQTREKRRLVRRRHVIGIVTARATPSQATCLVESLLHLATNLSVTLLTARARTAEPTPV